MLKLNPLDQALSELEHLRTREKIREHIADLEHSHAQPHPDDVHRFVRYVVRPYIAGVSDPLFASEFAPYWQRFKTHWRRVH